MNAGGDPYVDLAGATWAGDDGFSGGSIYSNTATITGTTDPKLYQSERRGTFSYALPVTNGTYAVALRFAEKTATGTGQRVFSVSAEGTTKISNLDVYSAAGGQNKALDRQFTVAVTDGTLNLSFTPSTGDAMVSAVEVIPSGVTPSGMSPSYTHDANGNQVQRVQGGVTSTYGYDQLNRMTSFSTSSGTSASYTYNGDSWRVKKVVGSTTTNYTIAGGTLPVVIADGASEYTWGLGLVNGITLGGSPTTTSAHADGLGSTRLLTNSSGTQTGTEQYDAFGATRSQSGTQLPFRYTGEQVDPESGLVYLRARSMDPATGRFLAQDPLQSGANCYYYANANPLGNRDPLGLAPNF